MGGSNVYISGAFNLTIGGTVRHLIKGDYHLEVEETSHKRYIRTSDEKLVDWVKVVVMSRKK